MSANFVPVIYSTGTKAVLKWYLLDYDSQLIDPAFNPQTPNEAMIRIPIDTYKTFGGLGDIQKYINGNAL